MKAQDKADKKAAALSKSENKTAEKAEELRKAERKVEKKAEAKKTSEMRGFVTPVGLQLRSGPI